MIKIIKEVIWYYNHYKQKVKVICLFKKLDEKEKMKLKYQNYNDILMKIEK